MEVTLPATEVEDGISYELTRSVIRHVAATLDFNRLDARDRQNLPRGYDVGPVSPATERHDWFMFQEEHEVFRKTACDLRLRKIPLPLEAGGIWHPPRDRNEVDRIHLLTSTFTVTLTSTEPFMDRRYLMRTPRIPERVSVALIRQRSTRVTS
jgi:hypothetical protein